MKISIIIADNFDHPDIDPDVLSNIGSTWGSWRTWRTWSTDNVICYDKVKAKELVTRAFQAVCNLYVLETVYAEIERPTGVKLFAGEFPEEFDNIEEVIAMHLVADSADIVLLLGYDLTDPTTDDAYEKHKRNNYLAAFSSVVRMHPNTQWVILDHSDNLPDNFGDCENISCDTLSNVLNLLE